MIVTNTESVPGREVTNIIGVVRGNSVHIKHFGGDIRAGLRVKGGCELGSLTEFLAESREAAYQRMIDDAHSQGADAVLNVHFVASSLVDTISEMLAYGTAVKLGQA